LSVPADDRVKIARDDCSLSVFSWAACSPLTPNELNATVHLKTLKFVRRKVLLRNKPFAFGSTTCAPST